MLERLVLALTLIGCASVRGQNVISAQAGLVHHVEGRVLLEGRPVEPKATEFPEVKNHQTLATEEGRAEVLLTPSAFLRLSRHSSFRMISSKLSATSFEIVSGAALIDVGKLLKDNAITVRFKDAEIHLTRKGLYRFDADPGTLRVYDGEAAVSSGEQAVVVHRGKEVLFGTGLQAANFDTKKTDAFYRWAQRRSEYITAKITPPSRLDHFDWCLAPGGAPKSPLSGCSHSSPGTGSSSQSAGANGAKQGTGANAAYAGPPGGPGY